MMRLSRGWWVIVALSPMLAGAVGAQQTDSVLAAGDSAAQRRAYDARRAALVKELQESQDELSQLRSRRVQLEARIEAQLAQAAARRAQMLLMSSEQNALLQLDTTLAMSQDNMLTQRDRMRALGDAVRRRTGAVLVVLFRADSAQAGGLGGVELQVDNAPAASHSYTPTAAQALDQGAVDQLYRSEVLPTTHTVSVRVTLGGTSVVQGVNVNAQRETVTYVQFTIRNGQVIASTWTSQGTTPF